jgi:hypothetical protein
MLSLHEYMWAGEGPDLRQNRKAIAFEVLGLPKHLQAWIAEIHYEYQILRAVNGIYGEWAGSYKSLEGALAAVQGDVHACN